MTTKHFALIAVAGAITLGCSEPELSPAASATSTSASATPEPKKEEQVDVAGLPGPPVPEDETPVTDVPRKFTAHDPIKGRRSRSAGGYLGAVGGGAMYAKFQSMIQAIDYANELYWPQHDFSYPKSHEEYMKEVVAPALNGIPLPEIPADEELIYVPEQPEAWLADSLDSRQYALEAARAPRLAKSMCSMSPRSPQPE